AMGDVTLSDWRNAMKRELISGLLLGLILGGLGFRRIYFQQQAFGDMGEHWYLIAIVVSLSLVGVVTWGSLIGSMLPIILRRFGTVTAISSTPFVGTLLDVT